MGGGRTGEAWDLAQKGGFGEREADTVDLHLMAYWLSFVKRRVENRDNSKTI